MKMILDRGAGGVAVALATFGALALAFAAGCGSDEDEGSPRSVVIQADAPPKGDPDLAARGHGSERVAITPNGKPVAIYATRLGDLTPDTPVRAVSIVTVTKCHSTDYVPVERSYTGCVGTRRYDYDPVAVTAQLRVVPDRHGSPDLDAKGVPLQRPVVVRCSDLKHHCTPVNAGRAVLDSDDVPPGGEDHWAILSIEATHPDARPCPPKRPSRCEVLAVEVQKHTAMFVATGPGVRKLPPPLPRDRSPNVSALPVATADADRDRFRKVVFSVRLSSAADIDSLLGEQLGVLGRIDVKESQRYSPLISAYLVLANRPDRIFGRYLTSDTYDEARRGDTGENCEGACRYFKPGAATTIQRCDVRAGRRFVNLVADASRDIGRVGDRVRVTGGYLEVIPHRGEGAGTGGHC